ncbi:deoxyribodipyrimidine photolyase [Lactiplantibacillus paraplantarum]|nr:deoxyribodipyrimidine photolyase [Lactiplantibacillus paraplantarum]
MVTMVVRRNHWLTHGNISLWRVHKRLLTTLIVISRNWHNWLRNSI